MFATQKVGSLIKAMHLSLIFALLWFVVDTDGTLVTDANLNQVLVEFDFVKAEDWSAKVIQKFRMITANYATKYCFTNFTQCGMSNYSQFSENDVVILQGYPQTIKKVDSAMLFYVMLPPSTASAAEYFVVRKAALEAIVIENRKVMQMELKSSSNVDHFAAFTVSYVNQRLVVDPSDQTLNIIMIPIVCSLVTIMILAVIALELRRSCRRKAEVKKSRQIYKKKKSQDEASSTDSKVFQARSASAPHTV